jgi:hypothetical protein
LHPAAPKAVDRAVIKLHFGQQGKVTSAEMLESTLPGKANGCLLQQAHGWLSPTHGADPEETIIDAM